MALQKVRSYDGKKRYRAHEVDPHPECKLCDGSGWVCEDHPSVAFECPCGAPGQPCECNTWPLDHPAFKGKGDLKICEVKV